MMLKEMLDKIESMVESRLRSQVVSLNAEPGHVYGVREPDGQLTFKVANPAPRAHTAGDLSAILTLGRQWNAAATEIDAGGPPCCWYSRAGVVLIQDDETRRDRVTMPLTFSPQLEALRKLEAKPKFTQEELVLWLRTTMARCFDGNILDNLRLVRFKRDEEGETKLDHGKSSVGRQLRATLLATEAIPETQTFDVPIFGSSFPATGRVECAVNVLTTEEKFQVIPIPGDIEKAIAQAEMKLGAALAEGFATDDVAVIYGSP